jgi:hypothetical protein
VLIIRRSNCINTASDIVTLCRWPSGAPEEYNKLIMKQEFVHYVGQLLRLHSVSYRISTNKIHKIKYSKSDDKTRLLGTDYYMFRHQGAILRLLIFTIKMRSNSTRNTCCTYDPVFLINVLRIAPWCRNM